MSAGKECGIAVLRFHAYKDDACDWWYMCKKHGLIKDDFFFFKCSPVSVFQNINQDWTGMELVQCIRMQSYYPGLYCAIYWLFPILSFPCGSICSSVCQQQTFHYITLREWETTCFFSFIPIFLNWTCILEGSVK